MGSEVKSVLVAAHELKAPLSLMRQLALSLPISDTDTQPHICDQIVNIADRTLLQINDLAKLQRLEDGLFNMEPVSVRGVCESVTRDVEPLYGYDRQSLSVYYRNRHKLAVANSELLYSIIYHCCVNAMHYSDSDTSSVLTVSDSRNTIRIDVRDFGPALPMQTWRNINQRRLNQPTKIAMRPGSSGLGLYIATQFAQYMHADFGAIRHRDGTSFFIELPISSQMCLFG